MLNADEENNKSRHRDEKSEPATGDNGDSETVLKIKNLELELARVKLELVDAQCKNQELDHTIKNLKSGDSLNAVNSQAVKNSDQNAIISSSTNSLSHNSTNTNALATNLNGSNNSINSSSNNNNNNGNNWLSKTLTQFKEATNQVVQKAQKANKTSFD